MYGLIYVRMSIPISSPMSIHIYVFLDVHAPVELYLPISIQEPPAQAANPKDHMALPEREA